MDNNMEYLFHYSDNNSTIGCGHLTDKVYVVREYGGSYDDAWEHIMGIFTDKDKAQEFRDSYWQKVQDRTKLLKDKLDIIDGKYNEEGFWDMLEEDQIKVNSIESELYRLGDIACVEVKEYPLNEIVNRYYVEDK